MRLIDADVLLKDVERLIKQYEDMLKECEEDRRYRLYLDIEKEIEGMRAVRILIELPRTLFDLIENYGFSETLLAEPTIEAIPIKWLEMFEPLMTKEAYRGIKEAISQWNGDYEIIDEARRCIDSIFRKAMR